MLGQVLHFLFNTALFSQVFCITKRVLKLTERRLKNYHGKFQLHVCTYDKIGRRIQVVSFGQTTGIAICIIHKINN